MQVFKFGGASVKDAESVANVSTIVRKFQNEPLVVIVSAMGKTTNALEEVFQAQQRKEVPLALELLDKVKLAHFEIINALFDESQTPLRVEVEHLFKQVENLLKGFLPPKPNYVYDQIVSLGELLSTVIVSHYLNHLGVENKWFDARTLVKTDYTFREAKIDWVRTEALIQTSIGAYMEWGKGSVAISQGFIGGADTLNITTLGREGSDYSAAVFAHCLNANNLTIWKDVRGVLNADPRRFENTVLIDEMSYRDSIELAYYGASVIHPKTLQPLQDKQIPLKVKSFENPDAVGTLIHQSPQTEYHIPAFIVRPNQTLISLATRDFAFIAEENLSDIFQSFVTHGVTMNIMQSSAINFSVCVDTDTDKLPVLMEELKKKYEVRYNVDLELLTVRHYNKETVNQLVGDRKRYIEQRTRHTYRVLLPEN